MNINAALSAYATAAKAARADAPATPAASPAAQGDSFAGLVRDSLKSAVDAGHKSEEMSMRGIAGDADMRDVVMAVNNAENALNTVVSVRDRVVTAYQEILRMPI